MTSVRTLCGCSDDNIRDQMLSMLILNETIRVDLVVFLAIFAEYVLLLNLPLSGS